MARSPLSRRTAPRQASAAATPTPYRQQNVEDASRTESEGGDEESNEARQAVRRHDATDKGQEEGGRREEEERSSPSPFVEVPEPWHQERKDSRREG